MTHFARRIDDIVFELASGRSVRVRSISVARHDVGREGAVNSQRLQTGGAFDGWMQSVGIDFQLDRRDQ